MAKKLTQTITSDTVIGCACPEQNAVSRWRIHVTAITGTLTVKACINGSSQTPIATNVVTTVGSTTAVSTITATGIYDIDSSGMSILLSPGGSTSYDLVSMVG